ncbi:MAG TPA: ATP-dependent DNA helicase RecG, partial [Anaerolineaceae bacterium]|nr:ATP-dependent DNA helicase RecG [Anaerolineaceae bacterium]
GLNAPLTVISGIGPRNAQSLEKLGLRTLADLLYYFPRRYDDYSQLKPISHLMYGDEVTVIGTIQSTSTRPFRNGQGSIIEAILSDGTGYIRLSWFNQPWLSTKLTSGLQIVVSGQVEMYLGRLVINSPDWEQLDQEQLHTNRIVPIYPLTANITQRWLRRTMYQTISFWAPRTPDHLPENIRRAGDLLDLSTALRQAHFPDNPEALKTARSRLAFDEIFLLQLGVLAQKRNWQSANAKVFTVSDEWMNVQFSRLPYTLTKAQNHALDDLRSDLAAGRPMNRLLQGDVGSGKTVVAAIALAMVTLQGDQTALMAPTSILAEQHYRNLSALLASGENCPMRPEEIRLMLGSTPEAEKEEIRAGLNDGSIKLVIGTHALIEAPVTFQHLQMVVIDEQHRFGVSQRAALRSKGENPHLLVMTATPIPRSLALTVYGDLDLTVIDEMPIGRQPIETHVLRPNEIERAYQLIQSQISKGRQAFIIYPLIEKGERDDAKAAVDEHARLQTHIFPQLKLGLLHGRMRPDEKEEVMAAFRDNKFPVLVSTSVVEVGVDISNATVMLIEGANRFGLSQLHQFRGRVGRGAAQSYCLLVPDTENEVENQRLEVMAETNDGFVLAERDLEQRGPGDFLGTRQSGFAELQMASLTDVRLIEKARRLALQLFEQDPDLQKPEHLLLNKAFNRFWSIGRGDIS